MKYAINFEINSPGHAAKILQDLAEMAEDGDEQAGDIYDKSSNATLGNWIFFEDDGQMEKMKMCEPNDTMEIKLVADTGTLFIGFREGYVWLGLAEANDPEPEARVVLTDRQLKVAVSELSILLDEIKEAEEE